MRNSNNQFSLPEKTDKSTTCLEFDLFRPGDELLVRRLFDNGVLTAEDT